MSESGTESLIDALASDEYEYVPVDELHEHPRNEEVYGELDPDDAFLEDIRDNGVETPLIVNEHEDTQEEWDLPNTVIGGHRRLEAARRVGLKKVPVRWKDYPEPMATRRLVLNNKQRNKNEAQIGREALLLEETARKINKGNQGTRTDLTSESIDSEVGTGRWYDKVGKELSTSGKSVQRATDVFRFAYPEKYVHEDVRNPEKYDVSEAVREEARRQVEAMEDGQSFQGARKKVQQAIDHEEIKSQSVDVQTGIDIRHGDALEELKTIEPGTVDTLLTDPPYGVMTDYEWDDIEDYLEFFEDWFTMALDTLADEHTGFVFADARRMYNIAPIIDRHANLKNTIIWVRKNMSKGRVVGDRFISAYEPVFYFGTRDLNFPEDWGSERFDVMEFAVPQSNTEDKKYHPTQKPIGLIEQLVRVGSYPGDTVLDPFSGVFTTGVATRMVGDRSTILIEKDEDYIEIGRGRLNDV